MGGESRRRRVVILGAAGRDFHDFNMVFRGDPETEVVAFTATQIPGIAGRRYPPALAGPLYPDGIDIADAAELERLCRERAVDTVVFAYSDATHQEVMHQASRALALGADFLLLGPARTMIDTAAPVIAVSAVRTGCGKSQTTRYLSRALAARGSRVAVIRHPMPYGDLARQAAQRFASLDDLAAAGCTIEEREEYEPHIAAGTVVFAGVDYATIADMAAAECDLILWDGGNNDFPFLKPDLHIVLADALRPGQETTHHPGEAVLRMADIAIIAKADRAGAGDRASVRAAIEAVNPRARIVEAASPVTLEMPELVRGKRVLVVEDGPTITHGGMDHGAGYVAAIEAGAADIVDPRLYADPEIAWVYERYPHIGRVLPAMGYGAAEVAGLERTILAADVDAVVSGTPIDLTRVIAFDQPVARVRYDYADFGEPRLLDLVTEILDRLASPRSGA